MKAIVLTLALVLAVGSAAVLARPDSQTLKGYLMDVSCQKKHAGEADFAAGHDKDCLQMCAKNGFGVITDEGKFIRFDSAGNKKVEQFLKDTDRDTGWKIEVTGQVKGQTMTVESISLSRP